MAMSFLSYREAHYGESKKETNVATMERVVTAPEIKPRKETSVLDESILDEYAKVAAEVGVSAADLEVERFRSFLAKKDIPTFNLAEVVKYMDDIAAKDNPTGLGWHWCPVREKDAEKPMTWGRHSTSYSASFSATSKIAPASDYYESHRFKSWHEKNGEAMWMYNQQVQHGIRPPEPPKPIDWRTMPSPVYTRTIPLHALKKIAAIEKEWTGAQVVFLVTDYTTAPHVIVNPDPFLMAVIPNSAVAHGKGRFIIDVWDEPGFGLDRMLKPAG